MKKLITIILILAMILPAAALADIPDISNLTVDELIELNHQIRMKFFSEKLINGVRIPAGVYTVGVDIPEGIYRVVYNPPYETAFCSFSIREVDGGSYSTLLGFSSSNDIGKLYFANLATVTIENGEVYLYGYTGLFD